ncbi:hypothetical protein [Desulforamulus ruminis]|uniref:Uncharacterized protein n=1 Tax=Desulforamulus ruminis (strain ATCC 23193 / DSM 2154 / NCIMB 8452 / DL) TaxID=696281 RepID=F6DTB8_DESRL|nr:hypothetical protein [Desulforamulus ruminis]AEG58935.1 hypothetical protein Desru_0650 [Desulforamulus ruminis DSM 2154]
MKRALLLLFLLLAFPTLCLASDNSLYYKNARMTGKVIFYDSGQESAVVYGSIYVEKQNLAWELIQSQKFERVIPVTAEAKKSLLDNLNQTVEMEGSLDRWAGQNDEIFQAKKVTPKDLDIDTPKWYALGKTIKPERVYKTNLYGVNDFVDRLAALAEAMEDKSDLPAIRRAFQKNWNFKWCLLKDTKANEDQMQGVGGWQIYEGLVGLDNCYIEQSPIIRKHLDAFMDAAGPGGGTPEKEGQALMCATIRASRDERGKIISLTASGPLYDSLPGFLQALKNPTGLHRETWRLEGWSEAEAKEMEGQLCWLSGSRQCVYETNEKGKKVLVDQYYALSNYLTRDDFDRTLDAGREFIGEGGV